MRRFFMCLVSLPERFFTYVQDQYSEAQIITGCLVFTLCVALVGAWLHQHLDQRSIQNTQEKTQHQECDSHPKASGVQH